MRWEAPLWVDPPDVTGKRSLVSDLSEVITQGSASYGRLLST